MKYLQDKPWNYEVPVKLFPLERYQRNLYNSISNRLTNILTTKVYTQLNITLEEKRSPNIFN